MCAMETRFGQQVIDYTPIGSNSVFVTNRLLRRKRITSRDPRPDSKGDARLWHLRLGHPGPMSLHKLGIRSQA